MSLTPVQVRVQKKEGGSLTVTPTAMHAFGFSCFCENHNVGYSLRYAEVTSLEVLK
jgi:hypothetical protein